MKKINIFISISAFAILFQLFLFSSTSFGNEENFKSIKFLPGKNSALVKGAVIRGERDLYQLNIKANQKLTVHISSLEHNAVFQIYYAKTKEYLKKASELDEATEWKGKTTLSGDYVIVVGGTRGNASYKLEVKIE